MTEQNTATSDALNDSDRNILFVQAQTHSDAAARYALSGQLVTARKLLVVVKGMLAVAGKADNDGWAAYYSARGALAQVEGKSGSALAMVRKALAVNRRIHPGNHYSVIIAEANVGEALGDVGKTARACKVMAASIKKLTACNVGTDPAMVAWKEGTLAHFASILAKFS